MTRTRACMYNVCRGASVFHAVLGCGHTRRPLFLDAEFGDDAYRCLECGWVAHAAWWWLVADVVPVPCRCDRHTEDPNHGASSNGAWHAWYSDVAYCRHLELKPVNGHPELSRCVGCGWTDHNTEWPAVIRDAPLIDRIFPPESAGTEAVAHDVE